MAQRFAYRRATGQQTITRRCFLEIGVASAVPAFVAACGRSGDNRRSALATPSPAGAVAGTESPRPGGTITYYQVGNPPTLDPQRTTSYFTQQPAGAVYSRLLRFKTGPNPSDAENRDVEGDLAAKVESPDAVTWIVTLRPRAAFHDIPPVSGHPVESEDVKLSFLRALDQENPNRASLSMIDAMETPSRNTIIFRLRYPYAPFPRILASPLYSWVLPRESSTLFDPSKQMIGSGPFKFYEYSPDVAFTFRKYDSWFESNLPYINDIRYVIIPERAQQIAQFIAGRLDRLDVDVNDVDTVRQRVPKAQLLINSPNIMYALVGQIGDPASPWVDLRVRQAFSMAIDRDAINKSAYGGKARAQAAIPLEYGKWALKPDDLDHDLAKIYTYNPIEAKKLLSAAGYGDLMLKVIYTRNGYAQPYATLAETVSNMLNNIGVKTKLIGVDYNSEYVAGGKGYRFGNFDRDTIVFGVATGGYTDIDEILFAYYHSASTRRNTRLTDNILDGMIDKARTILDENERIKAYLEIQRYIVEKTYFVTGWPGPPVYTMVQERVRNYQHATSYGFFTESFAKVWLQT